VVNGHLKDAFWEAVTDSLEAFHGFSHMRATARVLHLRSELEGGPQSRFEPDLIYHDEPFYIASRLAGREVNLEPHLPAYRAILARRFGHLEAGDPLVSVSASHAAAPRLGQGGW
jgi:hypothetical protein